jgi:hypothetical protein
MKRRGGTTGWVEASAGVRPVEAVLEVVLI